MWKGLEYTRHVGCEKGKKGVFFIPFHPQESRSKNVALRATPPVLCTTISRGGLSSSTELRDRTIGGLVLSQPALPHSRPRQRKIIFFSSAGGTKYVTYFVTKNFPKQKVLGIIFFFFAGFLLASEMYVFIPGFLLQGFEIFFPSAEQSDFLLWWLSLIQFWWSYPVFRPDRVSPWSCFVLIVFRPDSTFKFCQGMIQDAVSTEFSNRNHCFCACWTN